MTREKREQFHRHLDVCAQCRERPFDLCPLGATLLTASVSVRLDLSTLPGSFTSPQLDALFDGISQVVAAIPKAQP